MSNTITPNNSESTLRQATANAYITGVLSEMSLEESVKDGVNHIEGYLTLKTSDVNFVRVDVNINEKTKKGDLNSAYSGIQTVMAEYQPISKVGEQEATVVYTKANLNPYVSLRDDKENVNYRSNYFKRKNADTSTSAEFEVEVFINALVPEFDKDGVKTGRILIKGWVPIYNNGIEPITLVADEDIAPDIESIYNPGDTACFFGDIINNRIEIVEDIPVKIGKPRKKVTYDNKTELLITSVTEPYSEDSNVKPYQEENINNAIQARKEERASRKNHTSTTASTASRPSAASRGRTLGW